MKNLKLFATLFGCIAMMFALKEPVYAIEVNASPSNDTSKKIELTTSATDNVTTTNNLSYAWFYLDGNKEIPISGTSVNPYVKNLNSFTITYANKGNGTYISRCMDEAGNIAEERITINAWDTVKPLISDYSIDESAYTKNNEVLINEYSDNIKLADKPFRLSKISALSDYNYISTGEFTTKTAFTISNNGFYELAIKDFAGNLNTYTFEISNVDNDVPTITGVTFSNNDGIVNATVEASDKTAPDELKYCIARDFNDIAPDLDAWQSDNVLDKDIEGNPLTEDVYYIGVMDAAGNISTTKVEIDSKSILGQYGDDDGPLSPSNMLSYVSIVPQKWTNGSVSVGINVPANIGVNIINYKFNDGSWITNHSKEFNSNGNVKITLKDSYGNEYPSDTILLGNIDTEHPTLDINYTDENHNKLTITAGDEGAGVAAIMLLNDNSEIVSELYRSDSWKFGKELSLPYTYAYDSADKTLSSIIETGEESVTVNNWKIPKLGSYTFRAYDFAGNITDTEISVEDAKFTENSELNPATLKDLVSISPNDWSSGDIELSLNLNSNQGLAEEPYKWSGQSDFSNNNKVTVSDNGEVTVTVKDVYGNEITSDPILITNIDREPPVFTATLNENHNKITLNVTDTASGIKKITIQGGIYDKEKTIQDYPKNVHESKFDFSVPELGSYVIRAYDNVDNSSFANVEVTDAYTDNSELTPENITARLSVASSEWTNTSTTINLNLLSLKGLADEPYKWSTDNHYTISNSLTVYENGEYYVTVKDVYGNEFTSLPIAITNIDKTLPSLDIQLSDDGTYITLTARDSESGVTRIYWEGGALSDVTPIKEFVTPVSEGTCKAVIPNNGDYTIYVCDKAGNVHSVDLSISGITSPNPLLSPLGIYSSVRKTPESWTKDNVTLNLDLANMTGVDTSGYCWEYISPEVEDGIDAVSEECREYLGVFGSHTSLVVTENGSAYVTVTDEYGTRITSEEIIVDNIDKQTPEIDVKLNENSNGIEVYAFDGLSGLDKIIYNFNERGALTAKTYLGYVNEDVAIIPVGSNGTYNITVYDQAGNSDSIQVVVTNAKTDNLSDEDISNAMSVTDPEYTNGSVTIKLDLGDVNGLDKKPYSWDGGETWTLDDSHVVSENGPCTVLVKDMYGNIYTGTINVSNIDRTLPYITAFLNGNKVRISVRDDKKLDKLTYFEPSSLYEAPLKTFSDGENYDDIDFAISKDGKWVFRVYDIAGNHSDFNLEVQGLANQNTSNEPLVDEDSQYSKNEPTNDNSNPNLGTNNSSNNSNGTSNNNNGSSASSGSSNTNIIREYYYNNTIVPSSTPSVNNVPYYNPYAQNTMGTVGMNTGTTTPAASNNNSSNTGSNTASTATTNNSSAASNTNSSVKPATASNTNASAVKVTPVSTTTSKTTTTTSENNGTNTSKTVAVTETNRTQSADDSSKVTADAREMYRSNRIENTDNEPKKTSDKPLYIVLAILGAIFIIGLVVYYVSKYKETMPSKEKFEEEGEIEDGIKFGDEE